MQNALNIPAYPASGVLDARSDVLICIPSFTAKTTTKTV